MLKPVNAIKSKTVASLDRISDSNALTTESNPEKKARSRELPHPAKTEYVSKVEEIAQDKIDRIAKAMDNYIRSTDRDLKIKVHNETGQIMVKVISGEDGKVIREIPSEELLNLAAKVEEMTGLLFNVNT
jgi:flagellar protein FlaG